MQVASSLQNAKVVLISPVLDFGGVETRLSIQAERMSPYVRELRICTLSNPGSIADKLARSGIPVDVLNADTSIRNARTTVRLAKYIRALSPDILHTCIGEANWHGMIAGTVAGVPCRIAEEVGIPKRSTLSCRLFPLMYKLAHRVIGVSNATCRFLNENDLVPNSKIRLIYNTADPEYFTDPPKRTRSPNSLFRIIAVGRLEPVKNLEMLILAFSKLLENFKQAELVLIGDGQLRSSLESLVLKLGIAKSVSFLGFRNDVRQQLADADLYVLPSHSEGFGISIVEAMACSIPVLGTNVGGVEEIISSLGDNHLISPTNEKGWVTAMERMATMPQEQRIKLGAAGRTIVLQRFSPDAYINGLSSLYQDVLTQRCLGYK